MTVRYVQPTMFFDTNLWIFYEDPITKIVHRFTFPISATMVDNLGQRGGPLEALRKKMADEWGDPIELIDCGMWDNVKDLDGRVKHPFDKNRFLDVERELKA